ncbi:MAG: glycosyltransferase family 4 protein [Parcubacteria group bacterium]|nr:glycosyltransferase family 4 protein [Parcubacteria group bacterium]
MRILICTGVYPPDIGGPAKYAKNLAEEFSRRGHEVRVLAYRFEKKIPAGIRHCFYFLRVLFNLPASDYLIALDMFSTGFPAVLAGGIFGKKTVLRVGGDFLWETYMESTGNLIGIKDFYAKHPPFPLKFKIIALLQKFTLQNASALAFNSRWQKNFFEEIYRLNQKENRVVENFYPEKTGGAEAKRKNFLFAGRKTKFKNLKLLHGVFEELKAEGSGAELEIIDNLSAEELREKIKNSYALATVSVSDFAPNFIIEGLGADKPFILTKECGLAEKLEGLGVFVDPFDKKSVKEAVLFLMDENNYNERRERIARFGFTHSWRDIADEFLSVYKKV